MIYRFLGHCLAYAMLLACSFAQATPEINIGPPAEWIEPISVPVNSQAQLGSVHYHLSNSQVRHAGKSQQSYFQLVMEPLNQQGVQEISELNFGFYPAFQQLVVHEISVLRNGERIDRLNKAAFKLFQSEQELSSKLYSERWNALFILEDIRPGDIIRYAYTLDGSNPVFERSNFGSFYLSWPQAVDRRYVKIISDSRLYYRFNDRELPVSHTRQQGQYHYVVDLQNVPAATAESEYPDWYDPFNYIQYSSYRSWQEVSEWALGLYEIDQSLPKSTKDQLDQWRSEYGLRKAVSKAIRFVQEDIRYFGIELGINTHQPRTPRQTLEKRYGDCKDKAILLTTMLSYLGVESDPALVSSSLGRSMIDQIPSPGAFDHVINLVKFNGEEFWVDATASGQGTEIGSKGFFDYKFALPVSTTTRALKSMKPVTPANGSLASKTVEHFDIDAGANSASLEVQTTYAHLKAEQVRQFLLSTDPEQVTSSHTNFLAAYYSDLSAAEDVSYRDDLDSNRLVVNEQYQIENVAKLTSARKIFTLYGSSIASYIYKPKERIRRSPFILPHPINLEHKATANINGEVLWKDALDTITLDNPWFAFSRTATQIDDEISIAFSFESKTDHVRSEEIGEYLAQIDQLDQMLQYQFWAKGKGSGNQKNSKEMKSLIKSLIRK